MTWGMVAIGGATLVSGYLGSQAAGKAGDQQANAANNATQTQLQMFNTQNQQQAPYRQSGYTALNSILEGFGLPANGGGQGQKQVDWNAYLNANPDVAASSVYGNNPQGHYADWGSKEGRAITYLPEQQTGASGIASGQFSHQFNAGDLNANLAPNYEFQLQQGLGAAKNAGNLQTGLLSGNTLKGVQDYAQNYAAGAYQQAYNNYNTNQSNIFNRLSSIAGLGQTANQATGQAAIQTGQNVGNSQMAAGAAQAAGTVGQANAITGAANNALGWYSLSKLMNDGGSN